GGFCSAALTLAIWSIDSIGSSVISALLLALRKAGTSTSLCASSQLPVKVANTRRRACASVRRGNACIAPSASALVRRLRRETIMAELLGVAFETGVHERPPRHRRRAA